MTAISIFFLSFFIGNVPAHQGEAYGRNGFSQADNPQRQRILRDFIYLPAQHHKLHLLGYRNHELGKDKSPEIEVTKSME
jgi:hypothetical protein